MVITVLNNQYHIYETKRNEEKDGNIKNTTVANYLISSGIYNSKDIDNKISYELVSVPYNIEKELNDNSDNIEFNSYQEEIRNGKYRDIKKYTIVLLLEELIKIKFKKNILNIIEL